LGWWCTLLIPLLEKLREEDQELAASLRLIVRPCFNKQNKKIKTKMKKENGNSAWQKARKILKGKTQIHLVV
jgi:hypothetical protein